MDTQLPNAPTKPLVAPSPPVPPPPPGCAGAVLLPHWRNEPLPSHLAPSKEQIEKEQYAHLPDKLLNTLNKDKKPFTYTPSGVSGVQKGQLDLTNIRSPKMKKRLLRNLAADEEDEDQGSDAERVTRSETPEVLSKQKPPNNIRRAVTPEVPQKQHLYSSPNPPLNGTNFPDIQKQINRDFESFIQKQMKEMETSLKNRQNNGSIDVNGLEPEVQELLDSYANRQTVVSPKATPRESDLIITNGMDNNYVKPESTKPVAIPQARAPAPPPPPPPPHRMDNKSNYSHESQQTNGNNDLLRHVLDGGLQEEIEKFEQISMETEKSFESPNHTQYPSQSNRFYETKETTSFETFGKSVPNRGPGVWRPSNQFVDDMYGTQSQSTSPYGSLTRGCNRNDLRSPQPYQSPQSVDNTRGRNWSQSSSAQPRVGQRSASVEPTYSRSVDIPSNLFRSGLSEVPNYNSRPKPFYLCSEPPTPTATPPPQFMSASQPQPMQGPSPPTRDNQFSTFGKNVWPQKISYQNDFRASDTECSPRTKYLDGMYAQITAPEDWDRSNSSTPIARPPVDRNVIFADRIVTSPDRTGFKSPEPPKPILKKKLPPSERPPDPTPSKYMGANIPSRSFRFLQLMTGEDIDNQFITDNNNSNGLETRSQKPKTGYESCKQFNKAVNYTDYNHDFGTDF